MSADDDRRRADKTVDHDDAARIYAETLGLDEDEDEREPVDDDEELEAGPDSDDDLDDTVGESTLHDGAAPEPPLEAKRRLPVRGAVLVGLAGGLWALVAVKRCDGTEVPGPDVAITEEEPSAEEEPSLPSDDPEPAIEIETPPTPAMDGEAELDAEDAPLPPDSDPHPEPAPWTEGAREPSEVGYTVRHGGSIKNVANLFKIFHHEIQALNPGVELERSLPPNTRVVVYRKPKEGQSESIGLPSAGSLENGVPMLEGAGRQLKAIPWKTYGTANTVALLDRVLRQWAAEGHAQPVLVGNMSSRTGGRLEPHSTHQSGRDVDLGYPQKLPAGEELNWREMTAANLDFDETWALLKLIVQSGQVECIYIDRAIQKLLYDYALANGVMDKRALRKWMEYPRPTGSEGALIQHVKGHVDHMHVRFECQPDEPRCKSK
jgi:murein endopeptidase